MISFKKNELLIDNLNDFARSILVCPLSKKKLSFDGSVFRAPCGFEYHRGDFRVCLEHDGDWSEGQLDYENFFRDYLSKAESQQNFYSSVDRETKEIYSNFILSGAVLDIGGGYSSLVKQARLDTTQYVSVDAIPFLWKEYSAYTSFCTHYLDARGACRIPAYAEFLPFEEGSFDWVHMRSCIDHFANPYLACKEAFRVLKPGGKLLVGVSLEGAYKIESQKKFMGNLRDWLGRAHYSKRVMELLHRLCFDEKMDHHSFHPTEAGICELLVKSGFEIEKKFWQPGYFNVIYISALRR